MTFFIALVFMVLPGFAQEPETPLFRAGVSLVKVDVEAVDARGAAIPELTAADFRVYDEGQPRKIAHFGREAEPVDLVLLLDMSGSMRRSVRQLAETARAALTALHQGDRVAVIGFAREAAVRRTFTADFASVEASLREPGDAKDLGSGTAINAAIIEAASYAARDGRSARRAVLVMTDNLSLNYRVPDEDVLRALYGADAVLNAILIGKQKQPDPPRPGSYVNPDFTPSDVFKLARESGGYAVEARRLGESFRQMIERIRARYAIQYEAPPAAPGEFRRIRVELAEDALRRYPGAQLRARAGYYVP